ncbi:MAG: 6-phosphogluconate dehydrogenase (decarboxylating), partial [Hymenobacter sp.]
MHIGFVGLGKMGFNLVKNLIRHGHTVVGYDVNRTLVDSIKEQGAQGAYTLQELYDSLPEKRILWLMIPAGPLIDKVIEELLGVIKAGDTVIDGGNSHYKDSIRRHDYLKEKGIGYLDCG